MLVPIIVGFVVVVNAVMVHIAVYVFFVLGLFVVLIIVGQNWSAKAEIILLSKSG